jgi:hypothetical protein
MATIQYYRAANPIWFFRDLTGNPLDDTYYAHFLTNTLPYIPQPPFNSPYSTAGVWTGGVVQFQANGGLPDNLYFDPDLVYRIEIRQGSTQADPLIYEINNFDSTCGVNTSNDGEDSAFTMGNLVTNPQFDLISFSAQTGQFLTLSVTGSTTTSFEIAPGWFLDVEHTGNGSVGVRRIFASGTDNIPGQGSAYLTVDTTNQSNITSVKLRQRFNGNTGLFYSTALANRFVSIFCTIQSSVSGGTFDARLISNTGGSNSTEQLLLNDVTSTSFDSYSFTTEALPLSGNSQNNPNATVDLVFNVGLGQQFSITSVQLVSQSNSDTPGFAQMSNERKLDFTWHYYRESCIIQPKTDLLSGWNFAHNPWQALYGSGGGIATTAVTTFDLAAGYTADQTIIYQRGGASNVATGQASVGNNYAFTVRAVTADNKFAMIQYIDPETCRGYWNYKVSALIRSKLVTTNSTNLRFKVRLMRRDSLPSTIGAAEPFSSWANTDGALPVLASGWSWIIPENDPVYNFPTTADPNQGANSFQYIAVDNIQLPAATTANETLAIVIFTLNNMNETGTADEVLFEKVSLTPNEFAIDVESRTFEEDLKRCERYYCKSFAQGTFPAGSVTPNHIEFLQAKNATGNPTGTSGSIYYPTTMFQVPTITTYNPVAAGAQVYSFTASGSFTNTTAIAAATGTQAFALQYTTGGGSIGDRLGIHFTANSRLGR